MESNATNLDDVTIRLRTHLNEENIKLWLEPYYEASTGENKEEIERLARNFSESLDIEYELCATALRDLQQRSLEALKAREEYNRSGIAMLRVRFPSRMGSGTSNMVLNTHLTITGRELCQLVAAEMDVRQDTIKLIHGGVVLKQDQTLNEQKIKIGQQLMALVLTGSTLDFQREETNLKTLQDTKHDANLLAGSSMFGNNFGLELEDQFGNAIKLPEKERRALTVAMTLHEKGKAALRKGDHSLALVMFLEADTEFSQCNSQILETVDNYGLLNLDIVWCYMCLQSMTQLPDAEQRLEVCENKFQKSYGANLERLVSLKGSSCNEQSLLMRLHLLQAVCLYHRNRKEAACNMLLRAERELQGLKVDETSMCMLMELGYTLAEARIGLRATGGVLEHAVNFINSNRESREEARKKAKKDRALERERHKLGMSKDGKAYIEPILLQSLIGMGFPRHVAWMALKLANNSISNAIQLIQDNPDIIRSEYKDSTGKALITDEMISRVAAMGFESASARSALRRTDGDVDKAVQELITAGGTLADLEPDNNSDLSAGPSGFNIEAIKQERMAYDRLAEDLNVADDDYLDLTLVEEEMFLKDYKKLLNLN